MKPVLILVLFFALLGCNAVSEKEYESSKEKLEIKERKNPLQFLSVRHDSKRNLFGQTVVKGTITSSASVCAYKNVRVKLLYYNEEGVLVTNHEEVIDDILKPNNEIDFKAKYKTPKGTDSVQVSIMHAEVVE